LNVQPGAAIQQRVQPALQGPIEVVIGMWGDAANPVPFALKRLNVAQQVAAEFRTAAQRHLEILASSAVIPFAPGYTPDPNGAAEVLELPRAAFDYPQLIDAVLNPGPLPLFIPGHDKNIAFHCFVVRVGNIRAGFLRRAGGVLLARKGISGLLVEGRIESLQADVLTFSPAVDILLEPETLWISNVAAHRVLFRNSQVLLNAISANAAAIAAVVPIANLNEFEEACRRDPRMMAKLAHVSTRAYLQNLTPQAIAAVVQTYNLPAGVLNAAGELVHDNSPTRRWLILKVLDDSYLESSMTQEHYEVNSKLEV
jgi:hypothetical protein